MRQATGSNRCRPEAKGVSIQLTLDGHSFSMPAAAPAGVSSIELLTPLTLLVPGELFDPRTAAALFAAHGLPLPEAGMRIVQNSDGGPLLGVMAVPEEAMRRIEERFGAEVRFSTPLLRPVAAAEPTVCICDTGTLLYIRICDPALRLAETLAVASEADRSYLLARLAERIDPKQYVLQLEDRVGNARCYRNLFKRMICV